MEWEILSLKTVKKLKQQELEIDRLNDIFDELEKYLEKEISEGRSEDNVWLMGCYDEAREILDKIHELRSEE